jgi:hypothetical protein
MYKTKDFSANVALTDCSVYVMQRRKAVTVSEQRGPLKDHLSSVSETESLNSKRSISSSSVTKLCDIPCQQQLSKETYIIGNNSAFKNSSVPVNPSSLNDENIETNISSKDKNSRLKCNPQEKIKLNKIVDVFKVISKGTKLMKSLNFPTVIVKDLTSVLNKATVYYIILVVVTEQFPGEIPAIMFSSPYAHRKTRFAELLPLGLLQASNCICLTPSLQRKRFQCVFRNDCIFKIKSLKIGRVFDCTREHSWNRYDLSKSYMRNLPKDFIELDISAMSLHVFKKTLPLKHKTKRKNRLRTVYTTVQQKERSLVSVNLQEMKVPHEAGDSPSFTTFEVPRPSHTGGHSYLDCPKTEPNKMHEDKHYNYNSPTTGLSEPVTFVEELDKYW